MVRTYKQAKSLNSRGEEQSKTEHYNRPTQWLAAQECESHKPAVEGGPMPTGSENGAPAESVMWKGALAPAPSGEKGPGAYELIGSRGSFDGPGAADLSLESDERFEGLNHR
ncbi:hypothetical protein NE237_021992 [Protea cynaroides]|uniref:Uncharacterized protein n=1 Tax=Protea cynaroides TaxID=273540 RepID=A0A9Q0HDK4_9MAGN|nr:hypothetical protein NE237_021992 [Protea cynaroides]